MEGRHKGLLSPRVVDLYQAVSVTYVEYYQPPSGVALSRTFSIVVCIMTALSSPICTFFFSYLLKMHFTQRIVSKTELGHQYDVIDKSVTLHTVPAIATLPRLSCVRIWPISLRNGVTVTSNTLW